MEFTARITRTVEQVRTVSVRLDEEDLLNTTLQDAIEDAIGGHLIDVVDEDENVTSEWELDGSTVEAS